jgi:CP family cyanate transporter-like MFS transporter
MMGIAAAPGGRMVDRWGARATIVAGLVLVLAGGGLRAIAPGYALLIGLTLLFGIGIGIAQPALPRLARSLAPGRAGLSTSVYAAGFFAGSVLSAFVTAPILLPLTDDRTWRLPLAVWGILAAFGLIAWVVALPFWQVGVDVRPIAPRQPAMGMRIGRWSPWRDRGAWIVSALFLAQGVVYYLLIAWLPAIYDGLGFSERSAGALFAAFNLGTFPGMVALPALSDRIGKRRPVAAVASVAFLIGALGLALAADATVARWIWPVLAGFGVGGVFALTLLLPTDVAPPGEIGAVAAMVLAIGYLGSALGPVIGGAIRDLTGSFSTAIAVLPAFGLIMIALSLIVPELSALPARRSAPVAPGEAS